jgi:integrase
LTIADAGLSYIARPGGERSYDLWRLDQINRVVGECSIAQAVDAWSKFKRTRCGGLSPATVQRFKATFSAALNYLASEHGFDAPKLPRSEKVSNKRLRYLTEGQADRLIASYAPHAQPIAIMLRWQGLRIGEALRADWVHVNWEANSIFVPETKNGEPRTVTMHEKTRAALHSLWVSRGSPTEGPLFLTNRGKPYADPRGYGVPSGSPIKKAHATACRRAGIEDFHVHDWRHHWASQCVMAGIDLETPTGRWLEITANGRALRHGQRGSSVASDGQTEMILGSAWAILK